MKFRKCLEDVPPYQSRRYEDYCSGKLPCGRCISCVSYVSMCKYEMSEFDCENCKYKFICWSSNHTENYEFKGLAGLKETVCQTNQN